MKHKQTTPYGCGMYAVSHAMNIDNYVTPERLEQSKKGNTFWQLNKWPEEDGHKFNLDSIYFFIDGDRLPEKVCEYAPIEGTADGWPILLEVRYKEGGLSHLIAAIVLPNRQMIVMDILKDEQFISSLKEINNIYYPVYGLHAFQCQDTNHWMFYHGLPEYVK